jgi:hypothetical protein
LHLPLLPWLSPDVTQKATMTGMVIDQMLEFWCVELRQVKTHLKSLFAHPAVANSATAVLDGVLGPERRKTGWMRVEAAGGAGP